MYAYLIQVQIKGEDNMSIVELIKSRRSVRTFDEKPLSEVDRNKLIAYTANADNPFGVSVEFRLLDAKEYGLTSPVIVGAKDFLAAKVKRTDNFEVAFGYSFEKVCLYALSFGVGTVMLAASLNRAAFEKAMSLAKEEIMPLASPVGYPADTMSLREVLMRKALRADKRKTPEDLFYCKNFETALKENEAGDYAEALEAVRLAPSAGNGQPWKIVVEGDNVHFYEAKTMKDSLLGDIQKLDVGIAIAHFDLVRKEKGIEGRFVVSDPSIATPNSTYYIATFERKK